MLVEVEEVEVEEEVDPPIRSVTSLLMLSLSLARGSGLSGTCGGYGEGREGEREGGRGVSLAGTYRYGEGGEGGLARDL